MSTDQPDHTDPGHEGHPSPDDLRHGLDGRTSSEESAARITGHLDGCEACGRLLDELAGTGWRSTRSPASTCPSCCDRVRNCRA